MIMFIMNYLFIILSLNSSPSDIFKTFFFYINQQSKSETYLYQSPTFLKPLTGEMNNNNKNKNKLEYHSTGTCQAVGYIRQQANSVRM